MKRTVLLIVCVFLLVPAVEGQAMIRAKLDGPCRIRTRTPVTVTCGGKVIGLARPEKDVTAFQAGAGKTYDLTASTKPQRKEKLP